MSIDGDNLQRLSTGKQMACPQNPMMYEVCKEKFAGALRTTLYRLFWCCCSCCPVLLQLLLLQSTDPAKIYKLTGCSEGTVKSLTSHGRPALPDRLVAAIVLPTSSETRMAQVRAGPKGPSYDNHPCDAVPAEPAELHRPPASMAASPSGSPLPWLKMGAQACCPPSAAR